MILLSVALAAVVVIYFRSIDGGFLFDDHAIMDMDFFRRECYLDGAISWEDPRNHTKVPTPIIQMLTATDIPLGSRLSAWFWFKRSLRSFLIEPRAMTHLTYRWTWQIWHFQPWGWHLFNVWIHMLNTILVYVMAGMIRPSVAGYAALLFAVHPHQVAAVSYISGRAGLLTTFFALAGTIICNPLGGSHTPFTVFVACLSFILAERSKEDGLLWCFLLLGSFGLLRYFF